MIKLKFKDAIGIWNKGENNDNWLVKDKEGNVLFELQGDFNEKTTMQAIRMARKAEQDAYKEGVKAGKELQTRLNGKLIKEVKSSNQRLSDENLRITEQLERHINK